MFLLRRVYSCLLELHTLDVYLMVSLPLVFALCNGEHLAMWKAVGSLLWFFSFPHANSENCLFIIYFTYPGFFEIKRNDLLEFASVLSKSCTLQRASLARRSSDCWLLRLLCWGLFIREGRLYPGFYVDFMKMSFIPLLT